MPEIIKKQAAERIKKLRSEIERHRYLYHVMDAPEISDAALDSLKHELSRLEERFPEFRTADSPTQRVGGEPRKEFAKIPHEAPMLSFNDAFSEDEIRAWAKRNNDVAGGMVRGGWYAELKIDGLAVSLIYRKGLFTVGSTRGDGRIGEDVTMNLRTIEAIPLRLRDPKDVYADLKKAGFVRAAEAFSTGWPDELEVRGEVFMTTKEFNSLNKRQEKAGLPQYANPRNVAAGSIRQLDPKVTASRRLDSFAYDLVADMGQITHHDVHEMLRIFGFKINTENKYCRTLDEVFSLHSVWSKKREHLAYEIDGIVVLVDDIPTFVRLGTVGKAPRGAIAYKFALREAETVVEDIRVQVGRTGALTPVAVLRPVEIGGVTIRHATLHNEDEIARLGLRIGDTVIVGRAGDVIPKVSRILPNLRPPKSKVFVMPGKCPVCATAVVRKRGDVIVKCPNEACPAKHREWLYHFTSRPAFDIVGMGPKVLDSLLDEGLIEDGADIFTLSVDDFLSLPRFAERSAKKLHAAIAARTSISLSRFLYALGIPNVGEETARDLAEYFGSLERISAASREDFDALSNIGDATAGSIADWFENRRNRNLLEKFKKAGVRVTREAQKEKGKLSGRTFVLTGALEHMTRDDAKRHIREAGGAVSEAVSRKTDYLVVGAEPGEKYGKAKQLGVVILTEREFLELIS